MTQIEKMVWAAAYAESLARRREKGLSTRPAIRNAIRDADEAVLVLRDVIEADGQLHRSSDALERERQAEEV